MKVFITILATIICLGFSANVDTATTNEALRTLMDSQELGLSVKQFDQYVGECYTNFKTAFDALADSVSKTEAGNAVALYNYCTQSEDSKSLHSGTPVVSDNDKLDDGHCDYFRNILDGSDQIKLTRAAQSCQNAQCMSKIGAPLYTNSNADLQTGVQTFQKCVYQGLFYTMPHVERNYEIELRKCLSAAKTADANALVTFVADEDYIYQKSERATTFPAFLSCYNFKSECGRIKILGENDATIQGYAQYHKDCYQDLCEKEVTGDLSTYITCAQAAALPDYYPITPKNSNILFFSMFVLSALVLALF